MEYAEFMAAVRRCEAAREKARAGDENAADSAEFWGHVVENAVLNGDPGAVEAARRGEFPRR